MAGESALIHGFRLDGHGAGSDLDWDGVRSWRPGDGVLWVHLDQADAHSKAWLERESGLEPSIAQALLAEETRPRSVPSGEGLLVILRGVNLNPGADPEDMVSIRIWLERDRIVSTRVKKLFAVSSIAENLRAGKGPRDVAEFLVDIGDGLVTRISAVINDLEERLDSVEEALSDDRAQDQRAQLSGVRRQAIALRRYLSPQRDALARLQTERVAWLDEPARLRLREVADRTTRYVEDLEAARERAAVTQEEQNLRLSEQMNRRMYALSIIAGMFLPLSFLTGLLGINVAGIPGTEDSRAFALVCAALVVVAGFQYWLFRKVRWV